MSAPTARESWLRLALAPEIGPVLAHRLLDALGDPEAIFAAAREDLARLPGLGPARLEKLRDPAWRTLAREEMERAADAGVTLATLADENYPELLRGLTHPPLVVWIRGRWIARDALALAIVGPRNPSSYARLMTADLAGPLAGQGLTIVSGLAYGIDAEAHRAALEAGGRTLAVVGQGLGTPLYPAANAELGERIVREDRGALISIFAMNTQPSHGLFPARNEIIAALALGVLVVEASESSGALITARHAAAAGRQVLACPGDATRRAAQGSNRLIADGAALVQNSDDVLGALGEDLRRRMEEFGLKSSPSPLAPEADEADGAGAEGKQASAPATPPGRIQDDLARCLAQMLSGEALSTDAIIERCAEQGHAMSAVLERLLQWELDGHVRQMPGRLYVLGPARL